MNYEEFETIVIELVESIFTQLKLEMGHRNNTYLLGIVEKNTEKEGSRPIIYIDHLYKEYLKLRRDNKNVSMHAYAKDRLYEFVNNLPDYKKISIDRFFNKETVFQLTVPKVINYEKNAEYLMKNSVPYEKWNDLAVVPLMDNMDLGDGIIRTMLVTKFFLEHANISEQEIWDCIYKKVQNEKGLYSVQPFSKRLYYVYNRLGYGANILLSNHIFHEIAEDIESDLYIIPSSIHYVMVVPYNKEKYESVKRIHMQENKESPVEEFLSDRLYKYERKDNRIIML